jgi:hypothetical protein
MTFYSLILHLFQDKIIPLLYFEIFKNRQFFATIFEKLGFLLKKKRFHGDFYSRAGESQRI